ncbi:MAG: CBS domain-containing protein [Labilithrix sp.]|nr:CBS domain-containing protein [Labilithrix sp.]MCW5831857.1 CBS domain-containing protein [Labilithrix sp.]
MSRKLLYLSEGDRVSLARRKIIEFGVTAVPVLDETHRPVGMVSLRDLSRDGDHYEPTRNVATLAATDLVTDAAKALAASGYHHMVVVDEAGIAVGMVSAMDLLRALVGLPPSHPPAFDAY